MSKDTEIVDLNTRNLRGGVNILAAAAIYESRRLPPTTTATTDNPSPPPRHIAEATNPQHNPIAARFDEWATEHGAPSSAGYAKRQQSRQSAEESAFAKRSTNDKKKGRINSKTNSKTVSKRGASPSLSTSHIPLTATEAEGMTTDLLRYAALHLAISKGRGDIVQLMCGSHPPASVSSSAQPPPAKRRTTETGANKTTNRVAAAAVSPQMHHLNWDPTACFDDALRLERLYKTDVFGHGSSSVLKYLLSLKVRLPRAVASTSFNALHRACYHGRYEIAKYLIEECGCDPHMPTMTAFSPTEPLSRSTHELVKYREGYNSPMSTSDPSLYFDAVYPIQLAQLGFYTNTMAALREAVLGDIGGDAAAGNGTSSSDNDDDSDHDSNADDDADDDDSVGEDYDPTADDTGSEFDDDNSGYSDSADEVDDIDGFVGVDMRETLFDYEDDDDESNSSSSGSESDDSDDDEEGSDEAADKYSIRSEDSTRSYQVSSRGNSPTGSVAEAAYVSPALTLVAGILLEIIEPMAELHDYLLDVCRCNPAVLRVACVSDTKHVLYQTALEMIITLTPYPHHPSRRQLKRDTHVGWAVQDAIPVILRRARIFTTPPTSQQQNSATSTSSEGEDSNRKNNTNHSTTAVYHSNHLLDGTVLPPSKARKRAKAYTFVLPANALVMPMLVAYKWFAYPAPLLRYLVCECGFAVDQYLPKGLPDFNYFATSTVSPMVEKLNTAPAAASSLLFRTTLTHCDEKLLTTRGQPMEKPRMIRYAQAMLSVGANVSADDLPSAVSSKAEGLLIRLLLDAGVDVSDLTVPAGGNTTVKPPGDKASYSAYRPYEEDVSVLLLFLIEHSQSPVDILSIAHAEGCDVTTIKDSEGRPPTSRVKRHDQMLAVANSRLCSLHDRDSEGRSLLHNFSCDQEEQLIDFLVGAYVPPGDRDSLGRTPLHYLMANDVRKAARLLSSVDEELKERLCAFASDNIYRAATENGPGYLLAPPGATPFDVSAFFTPTEATTQPLYTQTDLEDPSTLFVSDEATRAAITPIAREIIMTATGAGEVINTVEAFEDALHDRIRNMYTVDLNATDHCGLTPLHMGCLVNMDIGGGIFAQQLEDEIYEINSAVAGALDWNAQTTADATIHFPSFGVTAVIPKGSTPLHCLAHNIAHADARCPPSMEELFELLCANDDTLPRGVAGIDPTIVDRLGQTPLHIMCAMGAAPSASDEEGESRRIPGEVLIMIQAATATANAYVKDAQGLMARNAKKGAVNNGGGNSSTSNTARNSRRAAASPAAATLSRTAKSLGGRPNTPPALPHLIDVELPDASGRTPLSMLATAAEHGVDMAKEAYELATFYKAVARMARRLAGL